MNGAIVADYVTAGTMTGDRIRGGELLVGGSGLAASGSITVKDSSNNTIGSWDSSGLEVKKGTIKGPNIEVGGYDNANGYLRVRDLLSNIIATLDDNGLYIYDTNGNVVGYFNANGLHSEKGSLSGISLHQTPSNDAAGFLSIDDATISGGKSGENTGSINWNTQLTGHGLSMQIRSDHRLIINTEELWIGTNQGSVAQAAINQGPFILPTSLSADGKVATAVQGVVFRNGIMVMTN